MIFGSVNQLKFLTTSRRDDIISLLFMLVYILNQGQLPGIDLFTQMDNIQAFKSALKAKENYSLDQLCCYNATTLKDFAKEVFSYKFKQCPNYEKLRYLLTVALSDVGIETTKSSGIDIDDDFMFDCTSEN
jgi:hypothetical protein